LESARVDLNTWDTSYWKFTKLQMGLCNTENRRNSPSTFINQ
jgi:hypothetical protein